LNISRTKKTPGLFEGYRPGVGGGEGLGPVKSIGRFGG